MIHTESGPVLTRDAFVIESRVDGYTHVRLHGTCPAGTTKQQVAQCWYHPVFGGREAEVWTSEDGITHFIVVRHTD
jgi:hypothetical protein